MSIRNGISDINNKWSFFQKFGSLAYISGFCLFSIFINNTIEKKLRVKSFFFWIVSLLFSLYVAYSQGGRGTLVCITLVYLMTAIFSKTNNLFIMIKKHWKKFILVPIVFLIMNMLWKRSTINDLLQTLSSGYSYLFSSFFVISNKNKYRFFVDFILMPIYFLPSSLYTKIGIKTANQFNTFLMQGGYKGEIVQGKLITGESTTGFLAFAYMQLGFLGVFISSIIYGYCLQQWQKRLNYMENSTFKSMLYAYYLVYMVYFEISGGDTAAFIIVNFSYFIFFFFFGIYYKIKIKI